MSTLLSQTPDADLPSWYDEMDHEGSMAGAYDSRQFADGGRVNYNTGGVADPLTAGLTYGYTPFMDHATGDRLLWSIC